VCARSVVGEQGIEAVSELADNLWPSTSAPHEMKQNESKNSPAHQTFTVQNDVA